jgi:hypothetical protein
MTSLRIVFTLCAGLVAFGTAPARAVDAPAAAPATTATTAAAAPTADDTAKFLAGLPVSPDSPLAPLTQTQAWKAHAHWFDQAFDRFDKRQGSKIQVWSDTTLTAPKPVLFYPFSGPDFLYADAMFPKASTYVLAALEPTGDIPDVTKVRPSAIPGELARLRQSMNSLLSISFFITHNMRSDLSRGQFRGTLPVLYVFLARTGHTVHDVSLVYVDTDGTLKTDDEGRNKSLAKGVKITMTSKDGEDQTLYYFSTNIGDDGLSKSGFLQFCAGLGGNDTFIKSASYLPHSGGFATIRQYILDHSSTIVQDDSGIPLVYFDGGKWQLEPFGSYVSPISIFYRYYQPKLRRLFVQANPPKLDFGFGYQIYPSQSNLLVAIKKLNSAER